VWRLAAGSVGLLGLRVRGTELLDAQLGEPLAHVNGSLERLALDDTSDEASSKGVTGTVGVVDLVLADGVYRYLLHINGTALLCADGNGGIGTLSEDNGPRSLGVLLRSVCDGLGNLLDVLGLDVVRLGECGGLSLVANEDVNVGQDLIKRVLEELGDEGC
jgi:hypothetical protein